MVGSPCQHFCSSYSFLKPGDCSLSPKCLGLSCEAEARLEAPLQWLLSPPPQYKTACPATNPPTPTPAELYDQLVWETPVFAILASVFQILRKCWRYGCFASLVSLCGPTVEPLIKHWQAGALSIIMGGGFVPSLMSPRATSFCVNVRLSYLKQ